MFAQRNSDSGLMWISVLLIVIGLIIIFLKLKDADYKGRGLGLIVAAVGTIMGVYVGMRQ